MLDLGGTTLCETSIALVLGLLVFNSVNMNSSHLHIFVFISNVYSLLSLPIFDVYPGATFFVTYITVSLCLTVTEVLT